MDSDSPFFKFKIGDKVWCKFLKTTGVVIGGDCYPEFGPNHIYYIIKTPSGLTYSYMEDDIELL